MAQDESVNIHKLSQVSDLPSLLPLLSRPLDAAGLLPPQFRAYSSSPTSVSSNPLKHFPTIQRALLESVLPTWNHILSEEGLSVITDQYFCPIPFSFAASQVALISLSTILSSPLNDHSIHFLSLIAKSYPIDKLHAAVFLSSSSQTRSLAWEDCVRNIVAVPAKVANSLAGKKEIPDELEHGSYFNHVCLHTEHLISSFSSKPFSTEVIQSVTYLLTKLARVGVFPPYQPSARSHPAFFKTCLPMLRERVNSNVWPTIVSALPSSTLTQSILTSLFSSLETIPPLDTSLRTRGLVKLDATLLQAIVGILSVDRHELWESLSATILGREWDEGKARTFVCWIAVDDDALRLLLSKVVESWSSSDHIRHSLLSRHHYMTSLLLITVSYFSSSSSEVASLALSPSFISGVGNYIKHLDQNVRRCGMLVAEEVARRAGKKLHFEGWDGNYASKDWIMSIRNLISTRDIDFETSELESEAETAPAQPVLSIPIPTLLAPTSDSDDESVVGYASDDASDRTPSPTPSDLMEMEKDPTLNVGVKRIPKPVYLAQLGELVRCTTTGLKSAENEEPQKIEIALGCGEELIRRKRAFGTELEENAVNLVHAFIGLQDNYNLDEFDAKRQGIVIALVACSPTKAAPAIIEEFFKTQYSTDQRFVMLTALALGGRELASLPVPPSSVSSERTSFPTKRLPPPLHRKLLLGNPIQGLLADISQHAIDKSKDKSADRVPELARERQLRMHRPPKIVFSSQAASSAQSNVTFTKISAEYFICPLVNRFWLFLRDEQTKESRTSHYKDALYRYRGAGTGLVLNAVVLSQFLSTLGVLIHAARNAPQWLAVVAPDALELAVALGMRPVSQMEDEYDEEAGAEPGAERGKEAAVLSAALELAVIVLDGGLELDGGRSLGLEHTALVLSTAEWAGKLLAHLEKGILVPGGGGAQELRLRRAAAGVVLKVDEMTSKWRRSMVELF